MSANVPVPVLLFGGDGNDLLWAGSSASVLVGGKGNDFLHGGSGQDVLIGGLGNDCLSGQGGQDLLIGGTTDYDNRQAILEVMLAKWKRTDVPLRQRIESVRGTEHSIPGNLNEAYLSPAAVHDDAAVDYLFGDAETDWYFGTQGANATTWPRAAWPRWSPTMADVSRSHVMERRPASGR